MKEAGSGQLQQIAVQVFLEGGHRHELVLREDAPELASLFRVLASRGTNMAEPAEEFLQLPLDSGRSACSFHSSQLVSVITQPPVLVQVELPEPPAPQPDVAATAAFVYTPRHVIIDDFLGLDEHRDMLAYALANQHHFAPGTVTSNDAHYRQNLVIMDFHATPHSVLIQNRLLTWFPYITQMLGMELFPLEFVESQLTASNDGHFFRVHADGGNDETQQRTLSCIYYFFREPRPFAGGALRLYDTWQQGEQRTPAASWQEIEPVSNRMVVFPSDSHHELMRIRCPSRQFADSRFAATNWLRRAAQSNPQATFGWGHMHCGVAPADFGLPKDQPA